MLRFGSMEDILKDVEAFDALGKDGSGVRATGNWTPAQNVDHVAKFINHSIDGFPDRAPLWLRFLGRTFRERILNRPMRAGLTLPKKFTYLYPEEGVAWPVAVGRLRAAVKRVSSGQRMQAPSPVVGRLAHEEWIAMHCRHAEMHFGFLHAAAENGAKSG